MLTPLNQIMNVAASLNIDLVIAGAVGAIIILQLLGALRPLIGKIYGEFSIPEFQKFSLLSLAFFLTIASYWMARTLKDAIFDSLVGFAYEPFAKLGIMVAMIPIVIGYNYLTDHATRLKVFTVICSIYASLFLLIGILYNYPSLGIGSWLTPSFVPGNILGWVMYLAVESYGGLIVTLFWSFTASTTTTTLAKRGYPLIIIAAQAGNILGPTLVKQTELIGFLPLLVACSAIIITIPFIIARYMQVLPEELKMTDAAELHMEVKPKESAWEGIKLIGQQPYLFGLAIISIAIDFINTVMDLQFKLLAGQNYQGAALAAFMGKFAQTTGLVSLTFACLGTGFFLKLFGVPASLILYPAFVGLVIIKTHYSFSLGSLFFGLVAIKALNYTLNSPIRELMYLPTSRAVKFKVKSFIEAFGVKATRGIASGFNALFSKDLIMLAFYGNIASFGVIGVWLIAALFTGRIYTGLIKNKKIIS